MHVPRIASLVTRWLLQVHRGRPCAAGVSPVADHAPDHPQPTATAVGDGGAGAHGYAAARPVALAEALERLDPSGQRPAWSSSPGSAAPTMGPGNGAVGTTRGCGAGARAAGGCREQRGAFEPDRSPASSLDARGQAPRGTPALAVVGSLARCRASLEQPAATPSWSRDHRKHLCGAFPLQRRDGAPPVTASDPGGPGRVASGRRGKPRIANGSRPQRPEHLGRATPCASPRAAAEGGPTPVGPCCDQRERFRMSCTGVARVS